MTTSLQGQVALVTDGGRGLGAAIALALADAGATIAPLAHESCELTAIAALLRQNGQPALGVTAPSYTEADAVAAAIDDARDYLGPITILVDVSGVPAALVAVLPDMQEAGWGCVVSTDGTFRSVLPLEAHIAFLAIDAAAPPDVTAARVRAFCLATLPSARER